MYVKKTYICGQVIEVEKVFSSKYKGKKTLRSPKMAKTEEAVRKVNERNAEKKLRRILNANFDTNSLHAVLTYRFEERPADGEQAMKDLKNFWRTLKRLCKKYGKELKYVAVAERSQRGVIHFHCIIDCGLSLGEIQEAWGKGAVHATPLRSDGDYSRLASYLLKQSKETFNDPERSIHKKRWCSSKNLVIVKPHTQVIKADSWRETPTAPKGYYVLKDTIEAGISEWGYPFQMYRCLKIEPLKRKEVERHESKINSTNSTKRKPRLHQQTP
jgi:hypothetical protein